MTTDVNTNKLSRAQAHLQKLNWMLTTWKNLIAFVIERFSSLFCRVFAVITPSKGGFGTVFFLIDFEIDKVA